MISIDLIVGCRTTEDTITQTATGGTFGVPNPIEECVFPFRYAGKTYSKCTNHMACASCYWCGTKYDVTDDSGWGVCRGDCPKDNKGSKSFYRCLLKL